MKQTLQNRWYYALSICAMAVPFAFALIRAAQTGDDFRYLWVALASLPGALVTLAVGSAYTGRRIAVVALAAGVFVISTLLAVLMALLLGTTFGPGIIIVGSAFGFCFAASALLLVLSRRRTLG
jgi:hypothetical protein